MRLVRTRKVWVIVIGVLITPALYAWFNINAFWDTYSATGNIRVAVVNLDAGADSELTGPVDVGAQVVEQLEHNDQLGWRFMGEDEAQHAVRAGDVYAAIIIPSDFSENLLSLTTGDFTQPALQYYVNEKSSAIAPKITDVGASTLDKQITSAFIEQVAQSATDAVKDAGEDVEDRLLGAKSDTLTAVDQAVAQLTSAQSSITGMQDSLAASRDSLGSAQGTVDDVVNTLGDVQGAIAQAQSIIADAQQQVVAFTDAATSAYVAGTSALADAAAAAHIAVTELTGAFDQVSVRVDTAIADIEAVVAANEAAIERLQEIADDAALDPATAARINEVIDTLRERNAAHQQLLADLRSLNDDAAGTSDALRDAAGAVDSATAGAKDAASGLRSALTDTVPALTAAMTALSGSAGQFSAALAAQQDQLRQASTLIGNLDGQIVSTSAALGSLGTDLANIQKSLQSVRTDVSALGSAAAWDQLGTITGLDAGQIARFIASPVQVEEQILFPVGTYGSAMAALFTNLSLWIGAFVLMVIFKIEVDTEGLRHVTVRQAYMGRFFLLAILVTGQALIVTIGNLVIGIQTASAVAYVGTGVLIGLAYLSIIYALSVAFGHVGRGLAVLLVIMQIPGASGLYPIEMMPDFFRAIYPFLPFTYGIDAMRETIAGFYDAHWWQYMGALALFVVAAFVLGLVLRRRLGNLNLLFNRRIAQTDLLIGERVQVTDPGPRLADVIHALQDRDEHRGEVSRGSARFLRRYPTIVRATLLTSVAGIIVLGVFAWAMPDAKAVMLAIWVLWCLAAIAFLVTIEYVRDSHERAQRLASLDDEDLRELALHPTSAHAVILEPGLPTTAPTAVLTAPAIVSASPRMDTPLTDPPRMDTPLADTPIAAATDDGLLERLFGLSTADDVDEDSVTTASDQPDASPAADETGTVATPADVASADVTPTEAVETEPSGSAPDADPSAEQDGGR